MLSGIISLVVKNEWRRSMRDGRSRSLFLAVLLMLIFSVALALREYKQIEQQYEENVRQSRLNWESQTAKDPHDAAHDGTYVIKPPHPLSIIDRGLQQFSGQVIHLGAHERKQSTLNEAKDHAGMFRFGSMAPNFVLLYVIPLLLIFLAHDSFTQERERQTLRLLFTQGVSATQLTLGKWLALFLQLMVLSLIFFLVVQVGFTIIDKSVGALEWLTLVVTYVLYLTIFLNLGLLVSARLSNSGQALTVMLGIWILMTLIVPRLSTNLAAQQHPFPTLQSFTDNINTDQANGLNGHNFWNEAAQDFQQQVLQEYGVASIEDLPVAYDGLLLAEGEKYESEIYTKHFDLLRAQYRKQREVYRQSGILSPFMPVRFISMALARTDYGFQWHYEDQAEKYRVALNTALNMNIAEQSKGIEQYKAGPELWASIPSFEYEWQPADEVLSDHLPEVLIVSGWALLSFLIMLFFNQKLKVI